MEYTKYFKLSPFMLFLALIIMCLFEYMAFDILTMPYSELEANADKYHPIMAYLFFGPLFPFLAIIILLFIKFLFSSNKGLILTSKGIVDNSSPFSIGEIPFENIASFTSKTNIFLRYKIFKVRRNELSIYIRKRKIDADWWEAKGIKGRFAKRSHNYTIPTKFFSINHEELINCIKEHIAGKNIKMYEIDLEEAQKNAYKKRCNWPITRQSSGKIYSWLFSLRSTILTNYKFPLIGALGFQVQIYLKLYYELHRFF